MFTFLPVWVLWLLFVIVQLFNDACYRIRMRKRELALRKVNGASNANLLSLLLSNWP